ncbi:MAG: S9 family peptidase [Bacteroidetes bacterium]|nr:S9 family peptidase [Fibrella sp.]
MRLPRFYPSPPALILLSWWFLGLHSAAPAQFRSRGPRWSADGTAFVSVSKGAIVRTDVVAGRETVLVPAAQFTKSGATSPLPIADFQFSPDSSKILLFTNTARVWRYQTRGDYYLLDRPTGQLRPVGAGQPSQSLLYAKLSPDGTKVAYVSRGNLYAEDVANGPAAGPAVSLTSDGTRQLINGTFDWAYEEEFGCRDGFRWSPDGRQIAYWQVDANRIRDYFMLNTTDSAYSRVVPVEYPKVGESPSPARIGVVGVAGGKTTWLNLPGDPQQHYLTRMEWTPTGDALIVQQLNRKQNQSILFLGRPDGSATPVYRETDAAWIDTKARWNDDDPTGWEWLDGGRAFLWVSEKDGWRHLYRVGLSGKTETLLTPGNYDIAEISRVDEPGGYVYFTASPDNPTQRYLYRVRLNGKGAKKPERLSPAGQAGTHDYDIAPGGRYAQHRFNSHRVAPVREWVALPGHAVVRSLPGPTPVPSTRDVRLLQVTTADGVTLDGWMVRPADFDSTKKYPVVFYVYGEPAGVTTDDVYSAGGNGLFVGEMAKAGYCYVALDNRGTPTLKGAAWRKSIYRQIGRLNIRDQAMGARKLFEQYSFLDTSRVAVWGWSGGGSTTLHLLFQYPEIYQTGIAIAAVGNQLFYDNIYQERYMGLPQENRDDFVAGSPVTYAKNLRGNLLYIHGTGDDNVHYDNAEVLLNELIKYNKQFQMMPYPNRTHGISEGEGTTEHLRTLYTQYLLKHCPPGGR